MTIWLRINDKQFTFITTRENGTGQHSIQLDGDTIVSSITSEDFYEWAANEIKYIVESKGDIE